MAEKKIIQPTLEEIGYDETDSLFWAKQPIIRDLWMQKIAPQILPKSKVYPLRIGYAIQTFLEDDVNIFGVVSSTSLETRALAFREGLGIDAKKRFVIRNDWELSFRLPKNAKDILRKLRKNIDPQDWTKIHPMVLGFKSFEKALREMQNLARQDEKVRQSLELYSQLELLLQDYWGQLHNTGNNPYDFRSSTPPII